MAFILFKRISKIISSLFLLALVACQGEKFSVNPLPTPDTPIETVGTAVPFSAGRSWEEMSAVCYIEDGVVSCRSSNSFPIGLNSFGLVLPVLPSNAIQVANGANLSCVVFEGGALRCFGVNSDPGVEIFTSGVTKVSVNAAHVCAIVNSALKCWGSNSSGELGDGTTTDSWVPVDVTGMNTGVTDVSVGLHSVCAIKSGAAYCWGYNGGGVIGNGTTVSSLVPVPVTGLTSGVTAITTSYGDYGFMGDSALAIKDGALYRWGRNDVGQLGNGTTTDILLPEAVPELASNVTAVDSGGMSACAIMSGEVWCFGRAEGALGFANDGLSHGPRKVLGITGTALKVVGGGQRTCAATSSDIYCWGWNQDDVIAIGIPEIPSATVIYSK